MRAEDEKDESPDYDDPDGAGDADISDSDEYEDSGALNIDWVVFFIRAAALITFGATLITSFDLSLNHHFDWLTVMRLAILPFVGGVLLLAAAELVERRGD